MIESGLNIVSALAILEEQTDDKNLAGIIAEVRGDVEGGLLLSEAMARHPKVFSRLYIAMVEAGEAAGILDVVLDRVALQIEKELQIKRRVKGAMISPTLVICFAFLVLTGMLLFLVPVFVKLFADLGGELPLLTRGGHEGVRSSADQYYIVFPLALIIFLFRRFKKTESGTTGVGSPPGPHSGRHRQGRPQDRDGPFQPDALEPRRRGRRHHAGARDRRLDLGQQPHRGRHQRGAGPRPAGNVHRAPLSERRSSRPMVAHMVRVGEETGELERMLTKVADFYEDEVDASIQSLTSIIEPLLMIMVGIIVGIIVIAMYLPMFKILTLIK